MLNPKNNGRNIFYPPGGILIWLIIILELLTFGIALVAFVYYGSKNKIEFSHDALNMNKILGMLNTILLISSGYFVAKSIERFKYNQIKSCISSLGLAMLTGSGFIIIKGFEYIEKINSGHTLGYSTFFTFYWLLTGFHLIHVIVGLIILYTLWNSLTKNNNHSMHEDLESGGVFWHLCDLIWLLLFPIIYLIY